MIERFNLNSIPPSPPPPPTTYALGAILHKSAGQRVRELFERRGVTAVANDLIVETGLRLLALSATVAYFLISLSLISILNMSALRSMDTISFWLYVLPLIFGFASCLLFVSTALEVVRSGFKAVFVCYVQVRYHRTNSFCWWVLLFASYIVFDDWPIVGSVTSCFVSSSCYRDCYRETNCHARGKRTRGAHFDHSRW